MERANKARTLIKKGTNERAPIVGKRAHVPSQKALMAQVTSSQAPQGQKITLGSQIETVEAQPNLRSNETVTHEIEESRAQKLLAQKQ